MKKMKKRMVVERIDDDDSIGMEWMQQGEKMIKKKKLKEQQE